MDKVHPKDMAEMTLHLDPLAMQKTAAKLFVQIEDILKISSIWKIPDMEPVNIVLLGMGGSAIGGDLLRSFCASKIKIPLIVFRDYDIPAFVGSDTLCIAVSYSGNTEETLSAYDKCIKQKAKVIAISSGGELEKRCIKDGAIFCRIPGSLQPRAALGHLFSSLLVILKKAGILRFGIEQLQETSSFLKEISQEWMKWQEPEENPPLHLAISLQGKIPVIYGSKNWMESIARRWKCQFNENTKIFSSWDSFPELNHNEIQAWEADPEIIQKMQVIILRDPDEPHELKSRIDISSQLIKNSVPVIEIYAIGDEELKKIFYLILFGDLASIYLAFLYGKDPSRIQSIEILKKKFAHLI